LKRTEKYFNDGHACLEDLKGFHHHKKIYWNYLDAESANSASL